MCSSPQSSRVASYSIAAAAAAAASGGAAHADVTSGSFDFSFGRSAGVVFVENMLQTPGWASFSAAMGDLNFRLTAPLGSSYADAFSFVFLTSANEGEAHFNRDAASTAGGLTMPAGAWMDAGDSWQTTDNTSDIHANYIFLSYGTIDDLRTWTNPGLDGTQFINFRFEGLGDAGEKHGWIQYDWDITSPDDWSVTVSDWAYSDDGPLAAGSTGAPAVPGLGGLAALAVGAAGVRGRRQRAAG